MSQLHGVPGAPDPWHADGALRAIEHLAALGRSFDAFDVATLMGSEPDHPNHWGSVFAKAKALGLIRKVGYAPSRRPGRVGGVCAVWASGRATP